MARGQHTAVLGYTTQKKPEKLKINAPDYSGFNQSKWLHHIKNWINFVEKDKTKSSWLCEFLGGQKLISHAKHIKYAKELLVLIGKNSYEKLFNKINGILITDDNKTFVDKILLPMGKEALGQYNLSQGIQPTFKEMKFSNCVIL